MSISDTSRAMLEELADLLDTLPPERFDYNHWAGMDWQGDPGLSCGTTACAAGWATTLESYRSRGLRLVRDRYSPPYIELGGYDADALNVMAKVLDIPVEHSVLLFLPRGYSDEFDIQAPGEHATAKDVAAHIRRYLSVVR